MGQVGTGAVLAAEMRGQARTTWVEPAIRSMLQSNGSAADILRRHDARACTDVTGFGLVGHLAEMLRTDPSRQAETEAVSGGSGDSDAGSGGVRNPNADGRRVHVFLDGGGVAWLLEAQALKL